MKQTVRTQPLISVKYRKAGKIHLLGASFQCVYVGVWKYVTALTYLDVYMVFSHDVYIEIRDYTQSSLVEK